MLVKRRRRWADFVQMLYKGFVFTGLVNFIARETEFLMGTTYFIIGDMNVKYIRHNSALSLGIQSSNIDINERAFGNSCYVSLYSYNVQSCWSTRWHCH